MQHSTIGMSRCYAPKAAWSVSVPGPRLRSAQSRSGHLADEIALVTDHISVPVNNAWLGIGAPDSTAASVAKL